jgi:hypothetical protein
MYSRDELDDLRQEFGSAPRARFCRRCGGYGNSHHVHCDNAPDDDGPEPDDDE